MFHCRKGRMLFKKRAKKYPSSHCSLADQNQIFGTKLMRWIEWITEWMKNSIQCVFNRKNVNWIRKRELRWWCCDAGYFYYRCHFLLGIIISARSFNLMSLFDGLALFPSFLIWKWCDAEWKHSMYAWNEGWIFWHCIFGVTTTVILSSVAKAAATAAAVNQLSRSSSSVCVVEKLKCLFAWSRQFIRVQWNM